MRQLKFGIEIEFFGVNYKTVVTSLQEQGIDVAFKGYTHEVTTGWKLVTDGSVTTVGTGLGKGLELVSPILYGDEGLDELQVVLNTLKRIGAKTNRTCGIHVHHDISDYEVSNVKYLYNLYTTYQSGVNSIVGVSRRTSADNKYCRGILLRAISKVNQVTTMEEFASILFDRYRVLNIRSYVKYGTVEFRQHQSSLNFDEVEAWIILTDLMVNHCRYNEVPIPETNRKSLGSLLKELDVVGSYVSDYMLWRKEKLKAC